MNDTQQDLATSILLPSAKIGVFSTDPETIQAAEYLQNDWRYARVHCQINNGTVTDAIDAYQESASPDLMIIQTDEVNAEFIGNLGTLASFCNEDTAAIVIGPDNDVNLYRQLIDMGISDYLVRPLQAPELSEVIAKTLIEKLGVSGSRLITCVGGKGGVGTSVIAQALSWGVADILKQKTLLIDVSGGWSTASVGMGFEPSTTLAEVIGAAENNDEDSIKRVIHKASDNLDVLANGAEIMLESNLSGSELEYLIDYAMARYPAVIVDTSHSVPSLVYTVLNRAHHIFTISTPAVSSLRLSRALLQEIHNLRGDNENGIDFIVNMAGLRTGQDVPLKDIEQAMGITPSAVINEMPHVFSACETSDQHIMDFKEGEVLLRAKLLPLLAQTIKTDIDINAGFSDTQNEGFVNTILSKMKKTN